VIDFIPSVATYRGVGIQDHQPAERIENVVRPAIDAVFALADLKKLAAYAADVTRPPEARLLAAAKCEAMFQLAVDERRARPEINLERVAASVAGLNSVRWRSPTHYASVLDVPPAPGKPGADPREIPLEREGEGVRR
jgi:hypothetical protein